MFFLYDIKLRIIIIVNIQIIFLISLLKSLLINIQIRKINLIFQQNQQQICYFYINSHFFLKSQHKPYSMKKSHLSQELNNSQKTLHEFEQPVNFDFHSQKLNFNSTDRMSPNSNYPTQTTTPSQQRQAESKIIKNQQLQMTFSTFKFGVLQKSILANCLKKYFLSLSEYLKKGLNDLSEQLVDFVSINKFNGLQLQKQQLSILLDKYKNQQKFSKQYFDIFNKQNSIIRKFLQEITYLNYEEINFELLFISIQMYGFKNQKSRENNEDVNQFIFELTLDQKIQFLNLKFRKEEDTKEIRSQIYFLFLTKLFEIIEQLYSHEPEYEATSELSQDQFETVKEGFKLFSSKRDLWDSQEEDDYVHFSLPSKHLKQ